MTKKPTAVDRVRLQESIVKAEKKETFPNRTALYTKVAEIYNRGYKDGPKITHSVVYLRAQEWGLDVKTAPGRVVIKKDPEADAPAPPPPALELMERPKRGGGESAPPPSGPLRLIHTPSGEPPMRLGKIDRYAVHEWCRFVDKWARGRGMQFIADAYIYWIRYYGPESFPREATMDRVTAWVHELYPPAVA